MRSQSKGLLALIYLVLLAVHASACATASVSPVVRPSSAPSQPVVPPAPPPAMDQDQFDGSKLYKAAFEAVRDHHIALVDSARRHKWAAEWEGKYTGTMALQTEEGTDEAIRAMLNSLGHRYDHHEDAGETRSSKEKAEGSLVGVGVIARLQGGEQLLKRLPKNVSAGQARSSPVVSSDHPVTIQELVEDGPAARAGLRVGDVLRQIDGQSLEGLTLHQAVEKLRGQQGTVVQITVARREMTGAQSQKTFSVNRRRVNFKVVNFRNFGDGIAHIKLSNFSSQHTLAEMSEALQRAAAGKGVIIDLRDNPGGRVAFAATIAANLLPKGTLVVLNHRKGETMMENRLILGKQLLIILLRSQAEPNKGRLIPQPRPELMIPKSMPMVVLVNERSASASELVSGALKYNRRAVVVGRTTRGKGVGQTVVQLPYGRQINVTSFEFLPGGRKINEVGVTPDVVVDESENGKGDKQLDAARRKIVQMLRDKNDTRRTKASGN